MSAGSAVEVARHPRSTPGRPRIADEHDPDAPRGERTPKPTNPAEAQFLAIGPGAAAWLVEAAATGVRRIRAKMADAVALAKLHGTADVDRALGTAATVGRFAEGDLLSILDHQGENDRAEPIRRSEPTACSRAPPPGPGSRHRDPPWSEPAPPVGPSYQPGNSSSSSRSAHTGPCPDGGPARTRNCWGRYSSRASSTLKPAEART